VNSLITFSPTLGACARRPGPKSPNERGGSPQRGLPERQIALRSRPPSAILSRCACAHDLLIVQKRARPPRRNPISMVLLSPCSGFPRASISERLRKLAGFGLENCKEETTVFHAARVIKSRAINKGSCKLLHQRITVLHSSVLFLISWYFPKAATYR